MKHFFTLLACAAALRCAVCQTIPNVYVYSNNAVWEAEPSIAAARDTNGAIHLASAFKDSGYISISYSADTGKTWQYAGNVPAFFSAGNDPRNEK